MSDRTRDWLLPYPEADDPIDISYDMGVLADQTLGILPHNDKVDAFEMPGDYGAWKKAGDFNIYVKRSGVWVDFHFAIVRINYWMQVGIYKVGQLPAPFIPDYSVRAPVSLGLSSLNSLLAGQTNPGTQMYVEITSDTGEVLLRTDCELSPNTNGISGGPDIPFVAHTSYLATGAMQDTDTSVKETPNNSIVYLVATSPPQVPGNPQGATATSGSAASTQEKADTSTTKAPPTRPPVRSTITMRKSSASGDIQNGNGYFGTGWTHHGAGSTVHLSGNPTASRVTRGTLDFDVRHTFSFGGGSLTVKAGGTTIWSGHVPHTGHVHINLDQAHARAVANSKALFFNSGDYGYYSLNSVRVTLRQS